VAAPPSTASPASPAAVHSTVRPTSAPVRVVLPPCPASHYTAAGLLRQGQALQASVLASFDRRDCVCRLRHWRWQVDRVVATCPHAPRASLRSQGRSSGLALAGLCAADRDAVEGFPWPRRPRGWTQLGGCSPGLRLAAAVLPAGRQRNVRSARSCVKARAARSPAPLGPRLDTRSLRVGCAA